MKVSWRFHNSVPRADATHLFICFWNVSSSLVFGILDHTTMNVCVFLNGNVFISSCRYFHFFSLWEGTRRRISELDDNPMFNILRGCQSASRVLGTLYIPICTVHGYWFSTSLPTLVNVFLRITTWAGQIHCRWVRTDRKGLWRQRQTDPGLC